LGPTNNWEFELFPHIPDESDGLRTYVNITYVEMLLVNLRKLKLSLKVAFDLLR